MKKTILFSSIFVLAVAGASPAKNKPLTNPIGYTSTASGETNAPDCALNSGAECFIVVNKQQVSPVYDSPADVGNSAKILKRVNP